MGIVTGESDMGDGLFVGEFLQNFVGFEIDDSNHIGFLVDGQEFAVWGNFDVEYVRVTFALSFKFKCMDGFAHF